MERRAHIRYEFDKELEYSLDHSGSKKNFKGTAINISDLGLGLYVFHPLDVGQGITLEGGIDLRGAVKWCHELGENIYRVGLHFGI